MGKWGLFANLLTDQGFVVASFDNRGSARRGRAFENPIHESMGTVEVEDQSEGVQLLISRGMVDPKKVGFMGWSYGGYLSLMLSMKAADIFSANVAVAPVVDFRLYDTFYTERYMGLPQVNKKAYETADVLNFVPNLKGRILVMHGMADDNVLYSNSTLLFKKLEEKGKLFESISYPGARHGISGEANQVHVFGTALDFFVRHLK
jgi:dipeptidyl-peptidase 4